MLRFASDSLKERPISNLGQVTGSHAGLACDVVVLEFNSQRATLLPGSWGGGEVLKSSPYPFAILVCLSLVSKSCLPNWPVSSP